LIASFYQSQELAELGLKSYGENVLISRKCSYGIVMKDFSGFSSRCVVYAETDDYSGEGMTNPTIPDEFRKVQSAQVIIRKHVLVGSGTTILPEVEIGEGASIGAMGFVAKTLEPWGIYVGSPVRRLRARNKNILDL